MRLPVLVLSALFAGNAFAATPQILTNHLGYETTGSKHAVILGHSGRYRLEVLAEDAIRRQRSFRELRRREPVP